jgi:hypothetical protein
MAIIWFGSPHEPYSGLPEDLALCDNLPDSLSNIEVSLTSNETGKRVKRPLREVHRERYAEITAMNRSIGKLRNYPKENNLKENTLVWYYGDNALRRINLIIPFPRLLFYNKAIFKESFSRQIKALHSPISINHTVLN